MKIRAKNISRDISIPGDKSISHRALILSAISDNRVSIENLLFSEDIMSTINILRALGVRIDLFKEEKRALVEGVGLRGLRPAKGPLDCGNSGTSMRLFMGLLAGQDFDSTLIGDESLSTRPMARVIKPLSLMGARIESDNTRAPIKIYGARTINSIDYTMEVASAQVKSAILLLDLYGPGNTRVREGNISRNHTEIMLDYFRKHKDLEQIYIPNDISSASFIIAYGLINAKKPILLKNIGLNKTRTGFLDVVEKMQGRIEIENQREINGEVLGDIRVYRSQLRGVDIHQDIGRLIDELPIIAVLASFAQGKSQIRGAGELRVKETDRIRAITQGLRAFNVDLEEYEDGLTINPRDRASYRPAKIETYNDHRIAMALSIFAMSIEGESYIDNPSCVDISFPNFYELFLI